MIHASLSLLLVLATAKQLGRDHEEGSGPVAALAAVREDVERQRPEALLVARATT